jgi:hypothetical protein
MLNVDSEVYGDAFHGWAELPNYVFPEAEYKAVKHQALERAMGFLQITMEHSRDHRPCRKMPNSMLYVMRGPESRFVMQILSALNARRLLLSALRNSLVSPLVAFLSSPCLWLRTSGDGNAQVEAI